MEGFAFEFDKCLSNFYNKTAVIYCDSQKIIDKLTYQQVFNISETLKTVLNNFVPKNVCIAIVSENIPILPSIILGIHKNNSPFMFIDPNDSSMLELFHRVKIKWVIDCRNQENNDLIFALEVVNVRLLDRFEVKLLKIDDVEPKMYENISYIIQTSGTTGENKIVEVMHNCIMSNINCFRRKLHITTGDIIYNGTILTFDPSIIEIFLPLTSGAALLIVPSHTKNNKKELFQSLFPTNHMHPGVTFLQFPPSVFLTFPEELMKSIISKESLRILALGGEKFPETILQYERSEKLEIYNFYGITEVSCWASIEKIEKGKRVSIGTPLDDTIFEVRGNNGKAIEDGEGELYIGSSKRICFVNNETVPLNTETVLQRTGDIVKVEKDQFYYVGRKNDIRKRFGHRICLTKIEQMIFESTKLTTKCIYDETKSLLILFIILTEPDAIVQSKIIDKIRIKLLKILHRSENPDVIEIIPNIPLTANGKTDLNGLLKISYLKNNIEQDSPPVEVFQSLFSKYFGLSFHQLQDQKKFSFLDLGGNSILAIQIVSEFETILNTSKYSSDLMELLLSKDVSYEHCCEWVEKNVSGDKRVIDKRKRSDADETNCDNSVKYLKCDIRYDLSIKWNYEMLACVDASPVLVDHPKNGKLIIIGSHAGEVIICNASTGELKSEISGQEAIESAVCPSACKTFVTFGSNDGNMYNLNLDKNKFNWVFKTSSAIKCTPILCQNNSCIIFGSYDRNLYCLSLKDGTVVWKNELDEVVKAKPVLSEERKCIFVTTLQGSCIAVSEETGDVIFQCNNSNPIFGSPCLYKELVIWADVKGNVYFKNIDSLQMVSTYKASGFIFSSLHSYKNFILFGCHDHNVYCLNCDNYELLFTINVDSQISSTPCTCTFDGRECLIVASNHGRLHLFDFEGQNLLGVINLPDFTFSSPIVEDNLIYIGSRNSNLYCIEIKIKNS